MPLWKRILWYLLLIVGLVAAVFVSMAAGILLSGSREGGMMLGLAVGLFAGQCGFAWRFGAGSVAARVGAAAGVFLLAAVAATFVGALGSVTNRYMYGLWDAVLPYLVVTVGFWEWAYRRRGHTAAHVVVSCRERE